jgi:SPFH domain / Band 7 family
MSSENEESPAIWQNTSSGNQNSPLEGDDLPLPQDDQQEEISANTTDVVQAAGLIDEWNDGPSRPVGMLQRFARQFSPVLVPILYAIITFVFVVPLILRDKTYLTFTAIIPFTLLLIVLAAVQGTLMYYAGSNEGLWSLCIILGFCLFLLVGAFAVFGFLPSLILLVVLLVTGLILARRCVRTTPEGYADIVQSFGRYSRTLVPGLNILLPWEKVSHRLSILELPWSSPMQRVPISQSQDVQFIASIAYQLLPEDAHIVALNLSNWEESVQQRFLTIVQGVMNELSAEDFIAWQQSNRARKVPEIQPADAATMRWERINAMILQRVQESVAEWGVQINWVGIRDLSLVPHIMPVVEVETAPGPRHANAPVSRGAPSLSAQAAQQKLFTPSPTPAPAQQPQPVPATATSTSAAPAAIQVDVLTEAYDAVRSSRITDPETIRSIARRFEAVASNPEETQKFGYDAARAAQNLYRRAQLIEEQQRVIEPINYDADTQPDWPIRRPANNNLMTGG